MPKDHIPDVGCSAPLIETINWNDFTTAVVNKAGLEFAIYDSAYPSRMPIVISSETTPGLLGAEYGAWRNSIGPIGQLMARAADAVGISALETITLKSSLHASSDAGDEQGGQLVFVFRAKRGVAEVPSVQDALNMHGQDIHNSYANERWGELLISVSRIICKCIT